MKDVRDCPHFEWRPGMLDVAGYRVVRAGGLGEDPLWAPQVPVEGDLVEGGQGSAEVDLEDPATLGALLGLVREAWGLPSLTLAAARTRTGDFQWDFTSWDLSDLPSALFSIAEPSEGEALVAALWARAEGEGS